jgi:hypothetical protein
MEGWVTDYAGDTLSINIDLVSTGGAFGTPVVLPNYLGGLTLSNDTTTPATYIDVAAGGATSDDNAVTMVLNASLAKYCNGPWVVGPGSGALDQGSALVANTWYHVFLIMRTDTQVVDLLVSTSATAPVMPNIYNKKRRLGSIKTSASSQIIAFTQFGDEFRWNTSPAWDVNNQAVATAGTLFTVNAPLGVKTVARIDAALNQAGTLHIQSPDEVAGTAVWNLGTVTGQSAQYLIRTNTVSQIRVTAASALASGFSAQATGWIDNRGK